MKIQTMDAATFLAQSDVVQTGLVLDVRTPAEVRADPLENSVSVPLDQLTPEAVKHYLKMKAQTAEEIYLICQTGKRAGKAAEKLSGKLSQTLIVVEGGLEKMRQLQGIVPVREVISLERQVRIAAGALVLGGVIAGFAVHAAGFLVSGFVGAGLIFAGITDTCGMAMLMAKAPWNR